VSRYALGAIVGALLLYALSPDRTVTYPEVIVPAARIIEREMPPGPPRIVERVKYVYLTPDVRATAPGAVTADVARFCRPVVVATQTDTIRAVPTTRLIRSVTHKSAPWPLRRDYLLVTSMSGNGELLAEDFRVRPGFQASWGERVTVRYPRTAPITEIGEGLLWYAGFRVLELVVR